MANFQRRDLSGLQGGPVTGSEEEGSAGGMVVWKGRQAPGSPGV